jgi:hypothetical protein
LSLRRVCFPLCLLLFVIASTLLLCVLKCKFDFFHCATAMNWMFVSYSFFLKNAT